MQGTSTEQLEKILQEMKHLGYYEPSYTRLTTAENFLIDAIRASRASTNAANALTEQIIAAFVELRQQLPSKNKGT